METTESNKLIAEFMKVQSENGIVFQDANTGDFHEIKYHSSWDWLMPVYRKIEIIGYGVGTEGSRIMKEAKAFLTGANITDFHVSIVEFIKWYNTQPKARLEYLRKELRAERISYGELMELQSLVDHIEEGDVELLEVAGVEEKH